MSDNELLLAISSIMDKKLEARMKPIENDIKTIRDEITGLRHNVKDIELHLENITDKDIQLLAENYVPAAKRYEKATAKIEAMQADIDIIKNVIREHSEKLQKISSFVSIVPEKYTGYTAWHIPHKNLHTGFLNLNQSFTRTLSFNTSASSPD